MTTPDGTSNNYLQCHWEFLGGVFGWGRKLTTGCSYGCSYGGGEQSCSVLLIEAIKNIMKWKSLKESPCG